MINQIKIHGNLVVLGFILTISHPVLTELNEAIALRLPLQVLDDSHADNVAKNPIELPLESFFCSLKGKTANEDRPVLVRAKQVLVVVRFP